MRIASLTCRSMTLTSLLHSDSQVIVNGRVVESHFWQTALKVTYDSDGRPTTHFPLGRLEIRCGFILWIILGVERTNESSLDDGVICLAHRTSNQ